MPSLITGPKASQIFAKFSGCLSASVSNSPMMRPVTAFRICVSCGLFCNISRERLSGRSLAVDDAADEAQVSRQQVRIVGDEHPPHVKLHLRFSRRVEQIEGLGGRRKQEDGVGISPLGAVV